MTFIRYVGSRSLSSTPKRTECLETVLILLFRNILRFFCNLFIIKQHSDRRRIGIIILTTPDIPEKKKQKGNGYGEADEDQ